MAQIREELVLSDKFSKVFSKYISQAEKASGETTRTQRALDKIRTASIGSSGGVDRLANSIKNLVGTYVGLQGLKNVLTLADTLSQTTARIDMMNDGLQTTEELTNMIYAAAQRSRGSFTQTANMVGQLGNLAGDAFDSTQELVAFAEQLNKQIALSGASATAADAAILQLTQGLSSGALRGEELNSVLEQTPTVAQAVANYLGVSTGKMREMASEGALTAEVVKNALLSAADETNAKFASMPMTFAQNMQQLQNYAIMAFQPVLQSINNFLNSPVFEQVKINLANAITAIATFAQQALMIIGNVINWVAQNWATIQPVLTGIVAALVAWKTATLLVAAAQAVLNMIMMASPLTWIILIIAVIIGLIAMWISYIGGLQVAWLIVVDALLTAWGYLQYGFYAGVYWVLNMLDSMALGFQQVGVAVANYVGQMKVTVLTIIQNMVNGAIDLINWFIEQLNRLPGVSISAIGHATFAATAAAEESIMAASRNTALSEKATEVAQNKLSRENALKGMMSNLMAEHSARQDEITQLQHASQTQDNTDSLLGMLNGTSELGALTNLGDLGSLGSLGGLGGGGGLGGSGGGGSGGVGGISDSVGSSLGADVADIKKEVAMSEEDLKSLVDMAERQYVNHINLTSQSPVIQIQGQNTGDTKADAKALADTIGKMLMGNLASSSYKSTARTI